MDGSYKERYSLVGEWYDDQASLARRYFVFYFPFDNTIEMFDCKNRKTFVRRTKVSGVTLDNFYLGCSLSIFGRQIKIIDYACEDTRKRLQKSMEVTFCFIKPVSAHVAGDIVAEVYRRGYKIARMKKAKLSLEDINTIMVEEKMQAFFPFVLEYLTNKDVYGMEVVGANVVSGWQEAVGHDDPARAAAGTVRARYGTTPVYNCVYVAPTLQRALKDLDYYFPTGAMKSLRLQMNPCLRNCSFFLVKPHALREGHLGAIMQALSDNGFDITALGSFQVEPVNAAEFYEVYKGIVTEFKAMCDELVSGACVAMEVVSSDPAANTAVQLRKLVGPADPEIARLLRPHTLRARFGRNKVQNAVHCSDLPEDGLLEVEYFFKILSL